MMHIWRICHIWGSFQWILKRTVICWGNDNKLYFLLFSSLFFLSQKNVVPAEYIWKLSYAVKVKQYIAKAYWAQTNDNRGSVNNGVVLNNRTQQMTAQGQFSFWNFVTHTHTTRYLKDFFWKCCINIKMQRLNSHIPQLSFWGGWVAFSDDCPWDRRDDEGFASSS